MKPLILASASPRRTELLKQIGIPFDVRPVEMDGPETSMSAENSDPAEFAASAADAKMKAALAAFEDLSRIVLCADTIVACEGRIFGKPLDSEDAARMLRKLSGRSHSVITACSLADLPSGRIVSFTETTQVVFHRLSEEIISAYISTGEPFGKAGAYAIQGYAAAFVERVDGCWPNVVGLPVARLASVLRDSFSFPVETFW